MLERLLNIPHPEEVLDLFDGEDIAGCKVNVRFPGRPIFVAHADTVCYDTDYQKPLHKSGAIIRRPGGILGADDRAGCFLIHCFRKRINYIITWGEETGCQGSRALVKEWDLEAPPCFICLDRRGKTDLIGSRNHYCETDLEDALMDFGFIPVTGSISDADELNEIAASCNLSIGYYNQHTRNEFLNLDILKRVPILGMSEGLADKTFKLPEAPSWGYYGRYSGGNYGGWVGSESFGYSKGDYGDKYDEMEDDYYGDSTYVPCDICGSFRKESTCLHYNGFKFCADCCEEISAHVIR